MATMTRKQAHSVGTGLRIDNGANNARLRNRAIENRLELWHGTNYGYSKRPDAAHYLEGTRPKLQGPTGNVQYRYAFDPNVADNDPAAPVADTLFWLSWQGSESRMDNNAEAVNAPDRYSPIRKYCRDTLLALWPNDRFAHLTQPWLTDEERVLPEKQREEILDQRSAAGEQILDEEFAQTLQWAIENVAPVMPPAPPENTEGMFRFYEDAIQAVKNDAQ